MSSLHLFLEIRRCGALPERFSDGEKICYWFSNGFEGYTWINNGLFIYADPKMRKGVVKKSVRLNDVYGEVCIRTFGLPLGRFTWLEEKKTM